MMPSPPIDHSYDTCHPRWLATGHDQVRIRALDWPVMVPQIPSCNVTTTSLTPMRSSSVCTKPTTAAASVRPLQAQPRG